MLGPFDTILAMNRILPHERKYTGMRNGVIILSIPEDSVRTRDILTLTAPSVNDYCDRHGLELLRIFDLGAPLFPKVLQCERLKLLPYFDRFDRFIFMDDSCIIAPDCPNLFDLVPPEKLGCVVEPIDLFPDREKMLENVLKLYGIEQSNHRYFNAGMLVFSQRHRVLFEHIHLFKPSKKWDQDFFNAMVNKFDLEIQDLGLAYNYLGSLIHQNMKRDFDGQTIYIYHLTRGCCGEKGRLKFGRKINERIGRFEARARRALEEHEGTYVENSQRLVFLFIVREDLVQKRLWEEFFQDADPERYECLYYSISGDSHPNIENLVGFPNTLNPQYGHFSYVQVVLMLLAYGVRNPRNYKFILLSESCIPLTSFQTVFNQVMSDDKSYLYHFQVGTGEEREITDYTPMEYPDEETSRDPELSSMFWYFFGPTSIGSTSFRYDQITDRNGIDRRKFHKFLAQGICFQRAFVEFLIETKGDLDSYQNVQFIEEHYYLCPLNKRKIPFSSYILKKCLMAVTWEGCRPKQYTSSTPVTQELVDRMRGWEFCFMRKVDGSCPMNDYLISYILERHETRKAVHATSMIPRSPNAVLTYCSGYGRAVYERFVGTLFDVGFDGSLVIFLREEDLYTIKGMANTFGDRIRFISTSPTLGSKYARYQAFYDYLTKSPKAEALERVFICDSRDVIFQKNVFNYPWDPFDDIGVFEENARIGECKWNSLWIKRHGEDIYEKLKGCTILCSGTILGKVQPIVTYLKTMIEIIEDEIGFDTIRRLGPHAGGDQGVFNYLFHMDRLLQYTVKRFKADDPLMITIHHAWSRVNDEGQIVDQNGNAFWCVHQFDRLPSELRLKHVKMSLKYDLATHSGTPDKVQC